MQTEKSEIERGGVIEFDRFLSPCLSYESDKAEVNSARNKIRNVLTDVTK